MADPIQSTGGGYRAYGYNGGRDLNFTPQHFAQTGPINMVRNGLFASWSQGTSGYPDAWEWNSIGTLGRDGATSYWGNYALKVTKINTDGDVTSVYQDITHNPTTAEMEGQTLTYSMFMKTNQGNDMMRPFIYDGTNYKYGPWYNGDNEWQRVWMSCYFDSAPTAVQVGIQVEETAETSNVYFYADCASCNWGIYPVWYSEHPDDRSIICQDWDDDGTQTIVRGAQRAIPFYVEHTTTAGRVQTITYTMDYGCDEIQHVSHNIRYTDYANYYKLQARAMTYTATGFSLVVTCADFSSFAAGSVIGVDGTIYCIGWDDPSEQFK